EGDAEAIEDRGLGPVYGLWWQRVEADAERELGDGRGLCGKRPIDSECRRHRSHPSCLQKLPPVHRAPFLNGTAPQAEISRCGAHMPVVSPYIVLAELLGCGKLNGVGGSQEKVSRGRKNQRACSAE